MTTIYLLMGVGVILLVYAIYFDRDPDRLDKYGEPVKRKRK